MSKIHTIKIIDLYEESDDFMYDIRRVLKHNEGLYVTDFIKSKKAYCNSCKHNNNGKCIEFDEFINNDSNICCFYEVIENGKFL